MNSSLLRAASSAATASHAGIMELDAGLLDLISGADDCGCCMNPQVTSVVDAQGNVHNSVDCG
jgi:hypothetical protein